MTHDPHRLLRTLFLALTVTCLAVLPAIAQGEEDDDPRVEVTEIETSEAPLLREKDERDKDEDAVDEMAADAVDESTHPLPLHWRKWLEKVDPLITARERLFFLRLDEDYQREAFIRGFWRVRDPYPQTARNELKEKWPVRTAQALAQWESLDDDRSRVFMVHGPPDGGFQVKCAGKRVPAEVWFYRGTDLVDVQTALVFLRRQGGQAVAKIWRPWSTTLGADAVLSRARRCLNGQQLMKVVAALSSQASRYEDQVSLLLAKPRPSSTEWLDTFRAHSTDFADDEVPIDAELDFAFPGRHQLRTVAQGLVSVAKHDAVVSEYAGYRSYDFRLTGEVLKNGGLFESFRYQFGFPAESAPDRLPMAFQRFLRPGDYRLVLKLDDLNSDRAWREVVELDVPQATQVVDLPSYRDPETEEIFREVAEAVASGEVGIRLVPPQEELLTGFTRFDTLVAGDEIEKVRFYLDDDLVLTKNRPPFQVQIDLGSYPDLHTLRVEGLDAGENVVADDELLINSGGYRFVLELREPRPGKTYRKSLRARAEVEVPDGRSLDRVEFYLDETKVATLYQEPFVQPMVLPSAEQIAYVRAVAYLGDGNTTEDLVFVNSPDYMDELEIQFVELYTTVLDDDGRPVSDLEKSDFEVLEDGVPQTISRFERVEDLPIHVGVLIDSSASMAGTLDEVKRSALRFFDQIVEEDDRAAVIPFNNFPRLAVELTNDRRALGSGLAGLAPEGQTALYDSVMYALYYLAGVKGQRAIVVHSDGRDESSRFDFGETLEYARRAGITIYAIGLRLGDPGSKARLAQLAQETGGTAYFLRDIEELQPVHDAIETELRSQLLIAYQSTNTEDDGSFRSVELKVDRDDVTVKTLSGYYP